MAKYPVINKETGEQKEQTQGKRTVSLNITK